MNANELADVLMFTKFQVDEDGTMIGVSHQAVNEAVTMLLQQQLEIAELKNSRDYWCLQYKDVMSKLDDMAGELMSLENSIRFEAGYGHN